MKPGVLVTIAVMLIVIVATFASLRQVGDDIPVEEIQTRIDESNPDWANYHEDLKAQIGATPVAKWHGLPVSAKLADGSLHITFTLEGYWIENQLVIPLLIRDNLGHVTSETGATLDGTAITYTFSVSQDPPPPWVELQYPHATRRIAFDTNGAWSSE